MSAISFQNVKKVAFSGSAVGAKPDSLYHRTPQLPPTPGENFFASIVGCTFSFMSSTAKLSSPVSQQYIFSDYRALINERESMPIPVLFFGCCFFIFC